MSGTSNGYNTAKQLLTALGSDVQTSGATQVMKKQFSKEGAGILIEDKNAAGTVSIGAGATVTVSFIEPFDFAPFVVASLCGNYAPGTFGVTVYDVTEDEFKIKNLNAALAVDANWQAEGISL